MSHIPSIEILESAHRFPTRYLIKAIGLIENDFSGRVNSAVLSVLETPDSVVLTERVSGNRRHVAVTVEANVKTALIVQQLYQELIKLDGLVLLL